MDAPFSQAAMARIYMLPPSSLVSLRGGAGLISYCALGRAPPFQKYDGSGVRVRRAKEINQPVRSSSCGAKQRQGHAVYPSLEQDATNSIHYIPHAPLI